MSTVTVAVADRVATVTLDRPHRHNAWTGRMHAEYREAMAALDADPDVRCVVVTGAGHAFSVGADSQALAKRTANGDWLIGLTTGAPPGALRVASGTALVSMPVARATAATSIITANYTPAVIGGWDLVDVP